jgi:hypothetical protein
MRQYKRIAFFTFLFASSVTWGFEGGRNTFLDSLNKRVEQKKVSRWTLQEWLSQKNQNSLMDQWLLMNTKETSPYEFYLVGETGSYDRVAKVAGAETKKSYRLTRAGLAAYAGLVGIEGAYDFANDDYSGWAAQVNFRLLGGAYQNTHIILNYGVQNQKDDSGTDPDEFQNQFAGVHLNFFVTQFFGLTGSFRYLFKDKSDHDVNLEGRRYEGGAFIDFSFVRIFGNFYSEPLKLKSATATSELSRQGLTGGLQLFF